MISSLDDFYISNDNIIKLNKWINSFDDNDINNIPLVISGKIGTGKTELVNFLLKDYTIINTNKLLDENIGDYLDLILYKKDISKWFTQKKKDYKCILFDNLIISEKKYIKEINKIIKNIKKIKCPIVITTNVLYNKKFNNIFKSCLHININYNCKQFNNIVKKIIKEQDNKIIEQIIRKSNNNLNSIISNYNYIKNTINNKTNNNKTDNKLDNNLACIDINYKDDIINLTNILNKKLNINEIYNIYSSEYNIVSLNILDNITISYNVKTLNNICNIYKSICLYDNYEQFKIKNQLYYDDFSILLSILIPKFYIKDDIKLKKKIKYNTYISKSLIYTHHNLIKEYNKYQYNYYDILLRLLI